MASKRMDAEAHERSVVCGCKVWYVGAEEFARSREEAPGSGSRPSLVRPGITKSFALERQASIAADNSSRTDASDSTDARSDSAALAGADPTLPSAQAACVRTSGSGSDSARVSTGTASGAAQLPSATHTLRAKPARPARRIADPFENESHASSSSAVSSSAIREGASVPG